jgi:hypothetical protein
MKKIAAFLILFFVCISCIGCFDNEYSDSSNWAISDIEFLDEYFDCYITNIDSIAGGFDLGLTQEISIEDENRFNVSYSDDDEIVKFYFLNDTGGFGWYRSDYCYFNENKEVLFDYSRYFTILSFVSDVNALVAFDYQGDERTYQELYENYLVQGPNTFYYHFDSVVGNIGYLVTIGDHYSETETRWYISFEYQSLLEKISL